MKTIPRSIVERLAGYAQKAEETKEADKDDPYFDRF